MTAVAVVACLVVAYGAVSAKVVTSPLTPAMLFMGAGLLLGPAGVGVIDPVVGRPVIRVVAEITLTLILFADAARIDVAVLRRESGPPVRLLAIGMPGAIAAGTAVGLLVLPHLGVWSVALLAALLAPTDAALGQPVVTNADVPVRVRQTLNVESGLNDGLALPVITLLVAAAGGSLSRTEGLQVVGLQLGGALAVGVGAGLLGGWIVDRATRAGWMSGQLRQVATLAIAVASFALAAAVGASGFVAAFVAGMTFGVVAREHCQGLYDFTEQEGHLLALVTFLMVGGVLGGDALADARPIHWLYAALSLTAVRMLPISLALLGTGLRPVTHLYLGWFGPRGLASMVFALLIVEESGLAVAEELFDIVTLTVLLSVVLHGATASVGARRYAGWLRRGSPGGGAEHQPVAEHPVRP